MADKESIAGQFLIHPIYRFPEICIFQQFLSLTDPEYRIDVAGHGENGIRLFETE